MRVCVPGAAVTGKGDDQIGLALVQHPNATNESHVVAFIFPVCRKLNQFESARTPPFAGDAVNPTSIAFDDDMKAVLGMNAVQFRDSSLSYIQNLNTDPHRGRSCHKAQRSSEHQFEDDQESDDGDDLQNCIFLDAAPRLRRDIGYRLQQLQLFLSVAFCRHQRLGCSFR